MTRIRTNNVVATLLAVLPLCGCAVRSGITCRDREQIISTLSAQDVAWNDGNIDGFMKPYWNSPDLTFSSGGQVTRGWQPTLEHYRKRYPTREAMGKLSFSELEITEVGEDAALVLGRWHLDREDPVGGAFTLVMRRMAGKWLIVHDHTSKDAK